jgi:hypothetical protein
MTATRLDPPAGPILEIGTLFGIFAGGLVRQFERVGQTRDITLVDPLVGRQLQPDAGRPDSIGGPAILQGVRDNLRRLRPWALLDVNTPVLPGVVTDNLRLSGLTDDRYRLIQGYSTDAAVRREAGDRNYAVVIVDGDHGEDGVYEDLLWVEQICADGAIVVLDDFADDRWTGVRAAWDRRQVEEAPFTLLGTVWTSGFLRYQPS